MSLAMFGITDELENQPELEGTHVPACRKVPVAKVMHLIPERMLHPMEHNQKIASCCRHPENHEIEARYSSPKEKVPDIYIFHCTCGRKHRQFMAGGGDARPFWDIR